MKKQQTETGLDVTVEKLQTFILPPSNHRRPPILLEKDRNSIDQSIDQSINQSMYPDVFRLSSFFFNTSLI
jgi:hypothetical protein